ncbi:MAG: undecaprenyldiphospho-muramoylpentapeptide beta-N-acetylglucosaminyltransferase [Nitrospinota bacterium]|nr:undecaprenyldiphospho-muramoylpentapeptide beta-N-acetylglucosaminyltransferase [Nitrospinota bacterium]
MTDSVVIAGGGTGGHLYPGIALAKALMKHNTDIQITFIGTRQGIESRVLPREGFRLKTIWSGGLLGKKGLGGLINWLKLPISVMQSAAYLLMHRPRLVVGVGGYVSGPVAVSAWMLRIPLLIHEQNTVPGATNRWLGKIADKVAITFEMSKKYFPAHKVMETGNMIREEFTEVKEANIPPSEKFTVLVLGGSQGAQSINRAVLAALDTLEPIKDRLHIIHQTGQKDESEVLAGYRHKGFSADARAFIYDMADQYRKASLIICRSGATTLAEVTALGIPAVLVPFPFAAHNHQEHNARALESNGAARVILDKDVNGKQLAQIILHDIEHPETLREMARKSFQMGRRDATERVRRLCTELMNGSD